MKLSRLRKLRPGGVMPTPGPIEARPFDPDATRAGAAEGAFEDQIARSEFL